MRLQHLLPHQLKQVIAEGWPLLVPTGCVEYHGPHLPLGVDTLLVEHLLAETAARIKCVVAPPIWYGPASHAVSGPDLGSLDVSTERFGRHVKDILAGFWDMGWRWIIVGVHHQGMEGPESLAIRQAAAEVMFERTHAERGDAWWGKAPLDAADNVFERIQVWPSVLPAAAAQGIEMADHAGYYETAFMLAAHPDLVDLRRLDQTEAPGIFASALPTVPWYANRAGSEAQRATEVEGRRMFEIMVTAWAARVAQLNAT